MRVYTRKAFMALPAGTVYCQGSPWFFGDIAIKGDTITHDGEGIDWSCLHPKWVESEDSEDAVAKLEGMLRRGESYPMQESYGRDGLYAKDAVFLVFENTDLQQLVSLFQKAIAVSKTQNGE